LTHTHTTPHHTTHHTPHAHHTTPHHTTPHSSSPPGTSGCMYCTSRGLTLGFDTLHAFSFTFIFFALRASRKGLYVCSVCAAAHGPAVPLGGELGPVHGGVLHRNAVSRVLIGRLEALAGSQLVGSEMGLEGDRIKHGIVCLLDKKFYRVRNQACKNTLKVVRSSIFPLDLQISSPRTMGRRVWTPQDWKSSRDVV